MRLCTFNLKVEMIIGVGQTLYNEKINFKLYDNTCFELRKFVYQVPGA